MVGSCDDGRGADGGNDRGDGGVWPVCFFFCLCRRLFVAVMSKYSAVVLGGTLGSVAVAAPVMTLGTLGTSAWVCLICFRDVGEIFIEFY